MLGKIFDCAIILVLVEFVHWLRLLFAKTNCNLEFVVCCNQRTHARAVYFVPQLIYQFLGCNAARAQFVVVLPRTVVVMAASPFEEF